MAVRGKGKEVVDARTASVSSAAGSSSGGKRKRAPLASPCSRGVGSVQRKRKRPAASLFIDDAAVDADDSDEFGGEWDSGEEEREINGIQAGNKTTKTAITNIPLIVKDEEYNVEEMLEFTKQLYGHKLDHSTSDEHGDAAEDPTIWRVRCMVGHEQHIVFCLVQKYVSLHVRGSNLPIVSAFALEHMKGYVFIEALKQHDVTMACKGFCNMYASKISLIPANEVPHLFHIQNKTSDIAVGMWVHMKNGRYKGDLAQVIAVDDVRHRATVKLVPRVDLQALAKKFGGGISLKQMPIPAPRLISSCELEDFRPHIEKRHDRETGELYEILDGLMLKDGYLFKKVSVLSLGCFGPEPTSAELVKFEPARRDEPQVLEYISNLYGGFKNSSEKLNTAFENKKCAFNVHDLVFFGLKDFGVIIAMKCGNFEILKGGVEEQAVVCVQQKDIKSSCIDKMFKALDRYMKTICINDTVKILEGSRKDRQGIVRHMYKGSLFVYVEEHLENTGFCCVKSQSCEVMKDDCQRNKADQFASKGSAECSSMPQSPTSHSEQCSYDVKRYHQGDRDQPFTVGQMLRIRVGPFKGYLCRAVRIFRSQVTVKLDSLMKLITVNFNHLSDANARNSGSRRDDTLLKSFDFRSEDAPSKGGSSCGNTWDFELASSTRASWPGLSTWGNSSSESKACNDQEDDPWGSKVTSGDGCREDILVNDRGDDVWRRKVTPVSGSHAGHSVNTAEQRCQSSASDSWGNWHKAEKSTEDGHEAWKGNTSNVGGKFSWNSGTSHDHVQVDSWNQGPGASGESSGRGDCGIHMDWPSEDMQGFGSIEIEATTDAWNCKKTNKSGGNDSSKWKVNDINKTEADNCNKAFYNPSLVDAWNRDSGTGGKSNVKRDWGNQTGRECHLGQEYRSAGSSDEALTDRWNNQGKTEKPTKSNSWKVDNTNESEPGGWIKTMLSDNEQEYDRKNEANVDRETGGSCAKPTNGSRESWDSYIKAGKSTEGKMVNCKEGSSSARETGAWSKVKSSDHEKAERWHTERLVAGESSSKVLWKGRAAALGKNVVSDDGSMDRSGGGWGEALTDGWNNQGTTEKPTKYNSWKVDSTNESEPGGWTETMLSDREQEYDRKNGANGDRETGGSCAKATKDSWESWDSYIKAGKSTDGKMVNWKESSTSARETGAWSKVRSSDHEKADRWDTERSVGGESSSKVLWKSRAAALGKNVVSDDGSMDKSHSSEGKDATVGGSFAWSSWEDHHAKTSNGIGNTFFGNHSSGWKGNVLSDRGNGRGRGKCFGQAGWSGSHSSWASAGTESLDFSGKEESYGWNKPRYWTHDKISDKGNGSRHRHAGLGSSKDLFPGQPDDVTKQIAGGSDWRSEANDTRVSKDSWTDNQDNGGWNNMTSSTGWNSKDSGTGNQTGGGWNKSVASSGWESNDSSAGNQAGGWNNSASRGGWKSKDSGTCNEARGGWSKSSSSSGWKSKDSGTCNEASGGWCKSSSSSGWKSKDSGAGDQATRGWNDSGESSKWIKSVQVGSDQSNAFVPAWTQSTALPNVDSEQKKFCDAAQTAQECDAWQSDAVSFKRPIGEGMGREDDTRAFKNDAAKRWCSDPNKTAAADAQGWDDAAAAAAAARGQCSAPNKTAATEAQGWNDDVPIDRAEGSSWDRCKESNVGMGGW